MSTVEIVAKCQLIATNTRTELVQVTNENDTLRQNLEAACNVAVEWKRRAITAEESMLFFWGVLGC